MRVKCPICGKDGFSQQRYNSVRVGHYKGYKKTSKGHTTVIEWHATTIEAIKLLNPNFEGEKEILPKYPKENSHKDEREFRWFFELGKDRRTTRHIQKEILLGLVGKNCLLCSSRSNLVFHEIHGKRHEDYFPYILKHKEDFVTMCKRCHLSLHLSNENNLDLFLDLRERINGRQSKAYVNPSMVNNKVNTENFPFVYQTPMKSDGRKIMSLAP